MFFSISSATPTADQTADPANAIGFQMDIHRKSAHNQRSSETVDFYSATMIACTTKLP